MTVQPRILIHIDHNPHPRVFDQIMSLDGGADQILTHGDVDPQDVGLLVAGALYSRPLEELDRTALLITGTNDPVIEEMVRMARRAFFGPHRVSLMSECKGGNTVAAATAVRIGQLVGIGGARILVVGGGPAGARIAGLLARAGADVVLTVFDEDEATDRREFIAEIFGRSVSTRVWKSGETLDDLLEGMRVIVTSGPPGLTLIPRAAWSRQPALELLVDVSGAEPAGIEGLSGEEDGDPLPDGGRTVRALGGLAILRYKVLVHRTAIARLFGAQAVVLGPLEIASIATEVISP